jgi:acetyl esterase/lipase
VFDLRRVGVSGFSSGGTLALVAASVMRETKLQPDIDIRIPVAFYPATNKAVDPKFKKSAEPIMPTPVGISRLFNDCYVPDVAIRSDPYVSPDFADPESFPSTVTIITASGDVIAAEANALAEKLDDGRRVVVNKTIEKVHHGFDKGCKEGSFLAKQRDEAYAIAIESLKKALA